MNNIYHHHCELTNQQNLIRGKVRAYKPAKNVQDILTSKDMKITLITGNLGKAEEVSRYIGMEIEHQKIDLEE
jgi:hypothetical protein